MQRLERGPPKTHEQVHHVGSSLDASPPVRRVATSRGRESQSLESELVVGSEAFAVTDEVIGLDLSLDVARLIHPDLYIPPIREFTHDGVIARLSGEGDDEFGKIGDQRAHGHDSSGTVFLISLDHPFLLRRWA